MFAAVVPAALIATPARKESRTGDRAQRQLSMAGFPGLESENWGAGPCQLALTFPVRPWGRVSGENITISMWFKPLFHLLRDGRLSALRSVSAGLKPFYRLTYIAAAGEAGLLGQLATGPATLDALAEFY